MRDAYPQSARAILWLVSVAAALGTIGACGTFAVAEDTAEAQVIELPFVTNRAFSVNGQGDVKYSTETAETSGGRCELSVFELPDAEVVVERLETRSIEATLDALTPGESGRVTLYVHGYNIGLERACRDAAVLARQTGADGRVLLFSWPASRTIVTYHKDAGRLAESMAQIIAMLDELGRRHGRGNVNIVAHSMGSRIVFEAIETLELADERFGNLVLIAPDIERELFVEALPDLKRLVDDITVLVSDKDRLLLVSQTVNLGARLGQSDGVDIDGVDVIDVTDVDDAGFGGHVYHLTNDSVGKVIGGILDGRARDDAAGQP